MASGAEAQNYSNIPVAPFSEDVTKLMKAGEAPQETLNSINTLLSKYRLMETSLKNKRDRFQGLLQELESSLKALAMLASSQEEMPYTYELGDTLYGYSKLPKGQRHVGLWLGAGVMLEYPLGEARDFLQSKREERVEELQKVDHDVDFIRAQITTTEVTIARLYNHLVRQNKK